MRTVSLLSCLLFLSACVGKNPTTRWAEARNAQTLAKTLFTQAANAGQLTPEEILKADFFFKGVDEALEKAANQLPDGGTNFEFLMNTIDSLINSLYELQLIERSSHGPRIRNGLAQNYYGSIEIYWDGTRISKTEWRDHRGPTRRCQITCKNC